MADIIHIHFESLPSTNDWAKWSILGGTTLQYPIVVSASEQTAGRGRHGHSFVSPAGTGVYMSYCYEKKYTEEEMLQITTRAADLILPVLQSHTDKDLHIKPVNDIYIGDPSLPDSRKIAGILTERVDYPERPGDYFIVVGIGVNCTSFDVPIELRDIVGFLEPDCSIDALIDEIANVLTNLLVNCNDFHNTEFIQ